MESDSDDNSYKTEILEDLIEDPLELQYERVKTKTEMDEQDLPVSEQVEVDTETNDEQCEKLQESRVRASHQQFCALLELMERYGDLAKPYPGVQGRVRSELLWKKLATILNSIDGGVTKTVEKWKRVWADWKCKTKKKAEKIHVDASAGDKLTLTTYENRVLEVMCRAVVGPPYKEDELYNFQISQSTQPSTPSPEDHIDFELLSENAATSPPPSSQPPPVTTSIQTLPSHPRLILKRLITVPSSSQPTSQPSVSIPTQNDNSRPVFKGLISIPPTSPPPTTKAIPVTVSSSPANSQTVRRLMPVPPSPPPATQGIPVTVSSASSKSQTVRVLLPVSPPPIKAIRVSESSSSANPRPTLKRLMPVPPSSPPPTKKAPVSARVIPEAEPQMSARVLRKRVKRTRRKVYDRANEFVSLEERRLRIEERRDRHLYELEARRLEVDRERLAMMRSMVDVTVELFDFLRSRM